MLPKNKKYTRRNFFCDRLDSENSKTNNNYQKSLISEILKNNKSLKLFSMGDKYNINNNVNNIKTNIQNIFSTDESKLKAIKYVINTRKEKRDTNPRYESTGKEYYPKLPKYPKFEIRENTPTNSLIINNMLNNDIDSNRSYNKRNILRLSSDNLYELNDEQNRHPFNYNFKGRDYYGDRTGRKYNKRKINNKYYFYNDNYEDNNNINDNLINNINTISYLNNKYNDYNKARSNIKIQKFPLQNNNNNRNKNYYSQKKNKNININITNINSKDNNNIININKDIDIDIKENNIYNDNNKRMEEEKSCINISFAEGVTFFDFHEKKDNEIFNKNNNNSSNKKDNNDEENNKVLLFNSHEISFRSFKNENDLFISNNSNNNSIEIFDGLNNKLSKEQKNDSVLSEKKNINFIKSTENNINIPGNKTILLNNNNNSYKNNIIPLVKTTENNINISGNHKELSFDSENDMINYIQNKNMEINNKPICIIYVDEYNKMKEDNIKNENEIKTLNKEKELYIENIIKVQNENELLRQKINEIYYEYQELYKTTVALKKENEELKNDYELKKDNKLKQNYNIEPAVTININGKNDSKNEINQNITSLKDEPQLINVENIDKNTELKIDDKEIQNNSTKEILNSEVTLPSNEEEEDINKNGSNTNTNDIKENNEEKKDDDKNNGILSKAMSKLINFFNEKKNE